jgi:hypothetical protein
MWIAYGMPDELANLIEKCLWFNHKKNKWNLRRHPGAWEKSSRDHWSYFILYRRLAWSHGDISYAQFIAQIPKMRGLYHWARATAGNKKHERKYYRLNIPGARIGNFVYKFLCLIGNFGPEWSNEEWIKRDRFASNVSNGISYQNNRSKWQIIVARLIQLIVPAYSLHNKGWQLYVMPDSKKRSRLCKVLLKRVDESNPMLRLLFGDKTVTAEDVFNYPHMTGYRPGVNLRVTFRTIRELTDAEKAANAFEKELLLWLWLKLKPAIVSDLAYN